MIILVNFFLVTALGIVPTSSTVLETKSHRNSFGSAWGFWDECEPGTFAYGFQIKVEQYSKWHILRDDDGMTGIRFYCQDLEHKNDNSISSKFHSDGSWTTNKYCPQNHWLVGYRLRVEDPILLDNTGANNIQLECSSGIILAGGGTGWGSFRTWERCPRNEYFCGVKTRVRSSSKIDSVGLVTLKVRCCPYKEEESTTMSSTTQTTTSTTTFPTTQTTKSTTLSSTTPSTKSTTLSPITQNSKSTEQTPTIHTTMLATNTETSTSKEMTSIELSSNVTEATIISMETKTSSDTVSPILQSTVSEMNTSIIELSTLENVNISTTLDLQANIDTTKQNSNSEKGSNTQEFSSSTEASFLTQESNISDYGTVLTLPTDKRDTISTTLTSKVYLDILDQKISDANNLTNVEKNSDEHDKIMPSTTPFVISNTVPTTFVKNITSDIDNSVKVILTENNATSTGISPSVNKSISNSQNGSNIFPQILVFPSEQPVTPINNLPTTLSSTTTHFENGSDVKDITFKSTYLPSVSTELFSGSNDIPSDDKPPFFAFDSGFFNSHDDGDKPENNINIKDDNLPSFSSISFPITLQTLLNSQTSQTTIPSQFTNNSINISNNAGVNFTEIPPLNTKNVNDNKNIIDSSLNDPISILPFDDGNIFDANNSIESRHKNHTNINSSNGGAYPPIFRSSFPLSRKKNHTDPSATEINNTLDDIDQRIKNINKDNVLGDDKHISTTPHNLAPTTTTTIERYSPFGNFFGNNDPTNSILDFTSDSTTKVGSKSDTTRTLNSKFPDDAKFDSRSYFGSNTPPTSIKEEGNTSLKPISLLGTNSKHPSTIPFISDATQTVPDIDTGLPPTLLFGINANTLSKSTPNDGVEHARTFSFEVGNTQTTQSNIESESNVVPTSLTSVGTNGVPTSSTVIGLGTIQTIGSETEVTSPSSGIENATLKKSDFLGDDNFSKPNLINNNIINNSIYETRQNGSRNINFESTNSRDIFNISISNISPRINNISLATGVNISIDGLSPVENKTKQDVPDLYDKAYKKITNNEDYGDNVIDYLKGSQQEGSRLLNVPLTFGLFMALVITAFLVVMGRRLRNKMRRSNSSPIDNSWKYIVKKKRKSYRKTKRKITPLPTIKQVQPYHSV